MDGLRFSVVLLIGLSLLSTAQAGVILHDGGQARFRLDFASSDLSRATSLRYDFFVSNTDPAGPILRSWRGQIRVFDQLDAGPVIGTAETRFGDRFELGASPGSLPGLLDDPLSFVEVAFEGADLSSPDPAVQFKVEAVAIAEDTEFARTSGVLAVMPTPTSLALLGLGLIGLGYQQRRKILRVAKG